MRADTLSSFLLWSKEDADRELAKLQVAHMGTPEFRIVRYRACKR